MVVEPFDGDGPTPPLMRLRCCGCAYGVSCRAAPGRCPMCGGAAWEYDEWRPFTRTASELTDDFPLSGSSDEETEEGATRA